MFIPNIFKSTILAVILAAVGSTAARAGAFTVEFSLNTTSIVGLGTFSLAFQMVDGSGTGDADNTVSLYDFNFSGGSASGPAMLFGGATGSVATGLTLTNSSPLFNAAVQGFVPGHQLTFEATLTDNAGAPFPDLFTMSILDPSGNGIPTFDTVNDSFLTVTLDGTTTTLPKGITVPPTSFFGADPSQTSYGLPAPTAVPEPSSLILLAASCVFLLFQRKVRSRLVGYVRARSDLSLARRAATRRPISA